MDRELECMKCFLDFLTKHLRRVPAFQQVPRGEDPPDFWLHLGQIRLAVEHTTAVEYLRGISSIGYWVCLDRLVEHVQREAKARGILRGEYVLDALQTPALPSARHRRYVIERCCRYIERAEAHIGRPNPITVWPRGATQFGLVFRKLRSTGARILPGGHSQVKQHGQPRQEAQRLLREIIEDKRKKLQKKCVPHGSAVLLLDDGYGFASPQDWRSCARHINEAAYFHTIFLLWRGVEQHLLTSAWHL